MPIRFRSAPLEEPFAFDSVGNHWNQERVIRRNGHHHYHFLLSEKGCGCVEIQGKTYTLSENEGILTAPFIAHTYFPKEGEWITAFATVTGTVESSIAQILGNRPMIFTSKAQGMRILPLIEAAMEQYEHPPADAKLLSVCCYRLLLELAEGVYTHDLHSEPLYLRYVAPVLQEIELQYGMPLTVADLCKKVYVTPQYLSRLFKRFLGYSVYEYVTAYRIMRAKELLLTAPRLEVQEIALRVGFEDASHFIKIFKKTVRTTPGTFRKENES